MAKIKLSDIDTRAPNDFDKLATKEKNIKILEELDELQNLLFAEGKHSVLIVIQGMDASGKDGVVRNVLGKLNAQGVTVKSYKAPTAEELSHDFLWRIHSHAPAKGMIQLFNRSHYEDIIITRVHKWCDDATAKKFRLQLLLHVLIQKYTIHRTGLTMNCFTVRMLGIMVMMGLNLVGTSMEIS